MVKLRLKRMGSKFNAFYRIVAADARAPRDGRFIEEVGYYNPHTKETFVNKELRSKWEKEGALASTTVKNLFKKYDKEEAQGSKDGVVILKNKPKKVKKQETKVDEIIAEKSEDSTEKNSEAKANDLEDKKEDSTENVLDEKSVFKETEVETSPDKTPSEEESTTKEVVEEKTADENDPKEEVVEEKTADENDPKEEVVEEEKTADENDDSSEEVK